MLKKKMQDQSSPSTQQASSSKITHALKLKHRKLKGEKLSKDRQKDLINYATAKIKETLEEALAALTDPNQKNELLQQLIAHLELSSESFLETKKEELSEETKDIKQEDDEYESSNSEPEDSAEDKKLTDLCTRIIKI